MLSTSVVVLEMSKMGHVFKFSSCLQRKPTTYGGISSIGSERSHYIFLDTKLFGF